jgi:hypothetical protein
MLNIRWSDEYTLVVTYETDTAYYGKRYERFELMNLHPLIRNSQRLLEDCINENKQTINIKCDKVVLTYIIHEDNNHTFDLVAHLQTNKSFTNNIFAIETKIADIYERLDFNDTKIDDEVKYNALLNMKLTVLRLSTFGKDETRHIESLLKKIGEMKNGICKSLYMDDIEQYITLLNIKPHLQLPIENGNYLQIEKINEKLNNMENNIGEKLEYSDLDDYVQDDKLNEKIEALEKQFDEKIDELKDGIICDFASYNTVGEMVEEAAEEIKKDILQLKLATDEKIEEFKDTCSNFLSCDEVREMVEETSEEIKKDTIQLKLATEKRAGILDQSILKLSRESHEFKRIIRDLQEKNKELGKKYTALSDCFDMFIFVIVVYCVLSIVKLFM